VPFGGFKQSGLGRELGPEGLASFLEPRSIGLPASLAEALAASPVTSATPATRPPDGGA
jgi:hypothetical protein